MFLIYCESFLVKNLYLDQK